jgi:PPM family protein phosphatase
MDTIDKQETFPPPTDVLKGTFYTSFGVLAMKTSIGGRADNQDYAGYSETTNGLLIVVCDGMGGAKGGAVASKLAVESIFEKFLKTTRLSPEEILTEIISYANSVVFSAGKSNQDFQGMGTTVTALLVNKSKATAAHVGDSRIYQTRKGRKIFRTFDHSMVFELVRRGSLTEEQARLSAESNVILRALGIKAEVEIEINGNIPYQKGDRFLLCSDGVSGSMQEKELIKLLANKKSVHEIAENLSVIVDMIGIEKGGRHDNHTTALLEIDKNSKLKPQMDRRTKLIIGIMAGLLIGSLILNIIQDKPEMEGKTNISVYDTVISKRTLNKLEIKTQTLKKEKEKMKENLEYLKKRIEKKDTTETPKAKKKTATNQNFK